MSEFNITVEGGKSVRLPTAGKYCDRDIVITAEGGSGGGGGATEGTYDSEFALLQGGEDGSWYCPPYNEGGTSFIMMKTDTSRQKSILAKYSVTAGERYKIYCIRYGELWETFVFAKNDYSSTAIPTDNANVGQYVQALEGNAYIVTIPSGCDMLFVNFSFSFPAAAFRLE